ncbi:MAG: NADH-quinone oxidoreductase subunit M [Epsilonproteobacteria bacterium]|nr:MAG: NADH-quinone oxidoreductase subunit M [Campylobacterota bacterium]
MENILSILVFFPAVAGLLGFVIDKNSIRTYAITVAAIEFFLSLWLWASFDTTSASMQFVEMIPLIPDMGISYYLGVDGISLFIIIMTTLMTLIGMTSMGEMKNIKNMMITLLFLEMTMIGVFVALDAIIFYLFWELSLVPMLYIVGAWGGPRRVYAAVKFFLYTFTGSLVMLVGMLFIAYFYHDLTGIWSFALTDWYALIVPVEYPIEIFDGYYKFNIDLQMWLFLAFFIGFAIKVPMFPFHTWIPYAHGQAPTIGSVILAAVLLKMGTYGFVRFSLPMFPDASVMAITPIAVLALIMVIYTAMIAYAQKDIKQVIAYSSVSHMGIIMLGLFAMNAEGLSGSVFQMLSHGIVSGALFMLVGMLYERRQTKMMSEFGGIAAVMPKFAIIFGIMLMASVGLPLTIGFVGEFLVLLGFYQVSPMMTILAGTSIILGAVYMLRVMKKTFFGPLDKEENKKLKDLNTRETWSLIPLVAIVIWLGVYPKPVLAPIDNTVKALLVFMDRKARTPEAREMIKTAKITMNKEEAK